jgi:putative lipoprotein
VIITAAHCVYSSEEGWAKDAVFVPDYDRAQADPDPVGVWTVRSIRTFNSWRADQTDYSSDVAYVTLNNGGDANKPVVDVVGGYGLAWGGSHVFRATIFGYPTNKTTPDGRGSVYSCVRTTERSEDKVRVEGCDFGMGASGGPWLYRYDEATELGYVRSVTSLWRPLGGANRGPYFTEAVKTMLDATAGD